MTTTDGVGPVVVTHALRRVRPSVYRIDEVAGRVTITLAVPVSAAGRRNAATRIVAALAGGGLALSGDDPITALTNGDSVGVARRSG